MTNEKLNEHLVAISKDVAVALWGEPNAKLSKGDKLRWGNKGSRSLDAGEGLWYDFEANTGGDVLALVAIQCKTDRRGAIQWLKDSGYWIESPPRRNMGHFKRRSNRPTRQHRAKADRAKPPAPAKESETALYAKRLWGQSKKIGNNAEHPFRRWTTTGDKPGVLHPYCAVPGGIRWHSGRGLIVCGIFPLNAWGTDGIPKGDPLAVQALALDQSGENRYCLGENKDLRRCSYGPVSAGVFILGDPTSERVNIVEGVADALAVYSREPGAVLATLGTSAKIANKADVIDWLCTKETWLYPDNDENKASEKGTASLINAVKVKSPDTKIRKVSAWALGDDPGEWAKRTPFPDIEIYDFEEKKGILFDSGMAWGEADRMAVQHLNGEQKQ